MSGTSTSVAVGGGEVCGFGYRPPPFTAVQWQELEHQAMIYKYLVAGLPVPPDLVMPIRRSFEAISARLFQHPSLGYCSYYGKKFDPEPGRCRRTDGKKWRCSKDAYQDSKYCERHMHRGRNRSRKPVESQSTSQSLSTAISHITTGNRNSIGSLPTSGSGSFQKVPTYSVVSSEALSFGSSAMKLEVEPVSYGIDNKEHRYLRGLTPGAEEQNFPSEASGSVRVLGMNSDADSTWGLMPSQVPSSPLLQSNIDTRLLSNSPQLHIPHAFDPIINSATSEQRQRHCFFGSEIDAPGTVKQEQHSMRPFFDEWPTTKEAWGNLEDEISNKSALSTTQLSISIPMALPNYSRDL